MWQVLVKRWWKYLEILSLKIHYSYETFEKWYFSNIQKYSITLSTNFKHQHLFLEKLKFSQKASIFITSVEINARNTGQYFLSQKSTFSFQQTKQHVNSGFTGIEGKFVTNTAYVDQTERDGAGEAETPLWLKSELPAEQVLVCATPVQPASFFSIFPPTGNQTLCILLSATTPHVHCATILFFPVWCFSSTLMLHVIFPERLCRFGSSGLGAILGQFVCEVSSLL